MKEIPLSRGYVAIVDDEDYDRLAAHKWNVLIGGKHIKQFHAVRSVKGEDGKWGTIYMHREITGAMPEFDVDHEDGNGLHNWRTNLRVCLHVHNTRNKRNRVTPKSSRFKGVTWFKRNGRWGASVKVDYRRIHLGLFADEEAAARAYDAAARQHFGEFAHPNFPAA